MAQHYSHKIEIYPNNSMKRYFDKCIGYSRYYWNTLLAMFYNSRKNNNPLSLAQCSSLHNKAKDDWELEMPNYIRGTIFKRLDQTIARHFKNKKKNGMPQFHCKKFNEGSFNIPSKKFGSDFLIQRGKSWFFRATYGRNFRLPRSMRYVRLSENVRLNSENDRICNATISKDCNKYYITFAIETNSDFTSSTGKGWIGIDPGVKNLINCSDGSKVSYPLQKLEKIEKQIKKCNQKMGKSQFINNGINSKNWLKAKTKQAKLWQKVRFIRNDFLHKLSTSLINNYKNIAIENNNIKPLLKLNKYKKQHNTNKSLSEAGIYRFTTMLREKGIMHDVNIFIISQQKAATQTCSNCGYRRTGKNKLKLKDRIYFCPICGHNEDRDLNAAKNILKFGMQMISSTQGNGSSS